MRLPAPEISSDPFMELEGKRIVCKVDGQQIRGRLISVLDGFLTLQEDRSRPRITLNKYEISSINEEQRPISQSPKLTRMFWR
ncbi:hypothetical protein M0R72_16520 [Candidatus Pacearchaeota archaeon]|jgi:hypothetical protein|nr:hypothetical protein [Candidatus Pacearchaeota archaeon]